MKTLKLSAVLLLCFIYSIYGASIEHCKLSVSDRIHSLKRNAKLFQDSVAFDPKAANKPVTKYEVYPNGFVTYGIYTDEVGISENVLWSMRYNDEHGNRQFLRVTAKGTEYQVTHDDNDVATLSTLQVLNKNEVQNLDYVPVLEKMLSLYKSAVLFHANVNVDGANSIKGIVTHYEISPNGDLHFEQDFALEILEKLSAVSNFFSINGVYTCKVEDLEKGSHGEYQRQYTYRLLSSDNITLGLAGISMVL